MPEKLKPCPACGAPYPRMVEHEMLAYVACDTIGCCLSGPVSENGILWRDPRAACAGRRSRRKSRDTTGMRKTTRNSRCMYSTARHRKEKYPCTLSFLMRVTRFTRLRACPENGPGQFPSRRSNAIPVLSCCRPCRYRLCRLDWLACVARGIGIAGAGHAFTGIITHIAGEGCFYMPQMRACR